MKKSKCIIGILSFIIVGLIVFIVLLCTGVIKCGKASCCKDNEITVNADELAKIKSGDFNIIKSFSVNNMAIVLLTNGKVNIDLDRELTNINNATDIELLNNDLYILTKDGNVYKYYLGVTKEATLEATKVDGFKDIKKMVSYATRAKNAGACDYIVAIDKDNNYKTIADFCV